MADSIRKATYKPVQVDAFRFGTWGEWIKIAPWAQGIYFVPMGYEHPLRRSNEFDRSNHHVHDHAPSFLVVLQDDNMVRVDQGYWIVRSEDGMYEIYSDAVFQEKFDLLEN